jgi:hypothetical protein
MFDEASVADWRGRDLRQANRIPNIDLLLLAVRQVSTTFGLFVACICPTNMTSEHFNFTITASTQPVNPPKFTALPITEPEKIILM